MGIYGFDSVDDFVAEMQRQSRIEQDFKNKGFNCPKCKYYAEHDTTKKGCAKGYCTIKGEDVSLKHICYQFEGAVIE